MRGGSSFHPRRFLAGVPRSTSSGARKSVDSQVGTLLGAVFGTDGVASAAGASLLHLARACNVSCCNVFVLRGGLSPARGLWQSVFCVLLSQRDLPGRVLRGISSEVDLLGIQKIPGSEEPGIGGAPEGIRTHNLLIRSQMLYPLSYRRMFLASDFFNPSRQQVLLYGCPRGRASRKTRNLPKISSERLSNTPFCRMIRGVLVS